MCKQKPTITITRIGQKWDYFQFFILGLYELEKNDVINLRFRCGWIYRLSAAVPDIFNIGIIIRALKKYLSDEADCLEGQLVHGDITTKFCIDYADSPYIFSSKLLDEVSVYFKMQCPKTIDPIKGFPLTPDIHLPYIGYEFKENDNSNSIKHRERKVLSNLNDNINKIKPLLCGFRRLAWLNSYSALKKGYENFRKGVNIEPTKKMMCYFGNAKGPNPSVHVIKPDYNWESDICGFFGTRINHPNEKRAKVAEIIKELGDTYDGRIISEDCSDGKQIKHDDLIVPIDKFGEHIAQFEYNMNVSGYRLSIPNRFIESLSVGTAIFTDKLAVKWYLPFDEEVIESAEMGYLPDKDVDWNKVEHDIENLPPVDKGRILDLYEKKWAPIRVAEYIVNTIIESC